jgi:hypothetical protein
VATALYHDVKHLRVEVADLRRRLDLIQSGT